ncbi:MAG: hypothetical protein KatS3mg001_487 [Candidatus Pacearchaeota archaeon]|nr:MAG: hypothetical protein KatS3mg001_487 [Candidatus Pacearchaeota archaeon]
MIRAFLSYKGKLSIEDKLKLYNLLRDAGFEPISESISINKDSTWEVIYFITSMNDQENTKRLLDKLIKDSQLEVKIDLK